MIQEGFYLLVAAQNPNWEMDIRARMQILLWPTQLAASPSSRILQSTQLSHSGFDFDNLISKVGAVLGNYQAASIFLSPAF